MARRSGPLNEELIFNSELQSPVGEESIKDEPTGWERITGPIKNLFTPATADREEFERRQERIRREFEGTQLEKQQYLDIFTGTGPAEWVRDRFGRLIPVPKTEYRETKDETVATSSSTSVTKSKVKRSPPKFEDTLESRIEENILDYYDAATYHFRLFLMGENTNRTGGNIPYEELEQVTLAESGSSTVGIDNVQIKTYGGMTKEAGSGVATAITFELKQAFSVTFLDLITAAAKRLGIKNYTKAPFYLELTFRARDVETQEIIKDGPLSNLKWVWPMILTKTNVRVIAGGSEYAIEGVNMGDLAFSNQAADLKKVEAIPATTVGDFFDELKLRLEKQQIDSSVPDKGDEYFFYIDEKFINERIIVDDQESAPQRSGLFEISDDKKTITFNQNTSIDRVVDSILSMTKYFQKKGTGMKDPDEDNEPTENKDNIILSGLWRVISDVELLGYNKARGDYNRRYKYLIVEYEKGTNKFPVKNEVETEEIVSVIRRRKRLKKLYNYVYTGENDQVLDFDVNFNFNWYATLPYNAGLFASGDETDNPSTSTNVAQVSQAEKADFLYNNPEYQIDGRFSLVKYLQASDLRAAEDSVTEPLQTQAPPRPFSARETLGLSDVSPTGDDIDPLSGLPTNLPRTVAPSFTNVRNNFILNPSESRLSETSAAGTGARELTRDAGKGNRTAIDDIEFPDLQVDVEDIIPVSYREMGPGRSEHVAASGEHTRGKSFLSAVFEQVTTPAVADLLNIDIKVKGDPYWLEPSPISSRQKPKNNIDVALQERGLKIDNTGELVAVTNTDNEDTVPDNFSSASTMTGETFFGFRMFTPQEYDERTGLMLQNTSGNLLNGLYGAVEITHEFVDGKFTQNIQAIRLVDARMNAAIFEDLFAGKDITTESGGNGA